MYNLQFTVYTCKPGLHPWFPGFYSARQHLPGIQICTAHRTLCTVHWTLYNVWYTTYIFICHSTLCNNVKCSLFTFTVDCIQYTRVDTALPIQTIVEYTVMSTANSPMSNYESTLHAAQSRDQKWSRFTEGFLVQLVSRETVYRGFYATMFGKTVSFRSRYF